MKKIPDWAVRALKTAAQAFGGVLVPEIIAILNGGWPESWGALWAVLSPVVSAALAAAICAAWNICLEKLRDERAENT